MIRTVGVYIPGHIPGIHCWCRPRETRDEWGIVWLHRQVILRPDRQPRAFQSTLVGPPA